MDYFKQFFAPFWGGAEKPPEHSGACPEYRIIGAGEDVLLVPGLGSSADIWLDSAAKFQDNYRFHLVDIPGFAEQAPRAENKGNPIKQLARDIAHYIDHHQLGAVKIIGHSMGGLTALRVARDYPKKVASLMLIDALPYFPLIQNPLATVDGYRAIADQLRAQMLMQDSQSFAQSLKQFIMLMAIGQVLTKS